MEILKNVLIVVQIIVTLILIVTVLLQQGNSYGLSGSIAGGAETFLMKVFRTLDTSKYVFDFIVSADGIYEEEVLKLGGKVYKVPLRTQNPLKVFNEIN